MSNVKFNLDKKDLPATYILLKFSYSGKRVRYSTGIKINPSYWNEKKQRAVESAKFDGHRTLNDLLDKLESDALNIHRRFRAESKTPTVAEFKKQLDIARGKVEAEKRKDLFSFIGEFITERERLKYAPKTIALYNRVRDILKEYQKAKRQQLDFGSINLEFYNSLLDYIYSKNYSINYAGNIIKTLKTFLNAATERGYNTNLAYKSKYFTKPSEDVDEIYLTESELTSIYHLDYSQNNRLDRVRDLFIVGAFTGLRFSDFTKINPENITNIDGHDVIEISTKKTQDKVIIPIHPFVKSILTKYDNKVPGSISNQKMNDYLKEIGRDAKIYDLVPDYRSNGGKRRLVGTKKKYELVKTHTARRSFATNAFKRGINSLSIMRITGHKTESAFMKYIRISNEENAVLMAKNGFFQMLKAV